MSTTQPSTADDSTVAFNHGFSQADGRADINTTTRALRKAVSHADSESDAADFAELFTSLVSRRQYTEGHHAVSLELSDMEIRHLHLAHMMAADSMPEFDSEFAETFRDNKKLLPSA